MPNFNVHWLVAWQAAEASPFAWIRRGRAQYLADAEAFKLEVHKKIDELWDSPPTVGIVQEIKNLADSFQAGLGDNAICFSAYMCGACGPDFWTLPSGSGVPPDTASHHFDLGHYNRTHLQFLRSIEALKGGKLATFQHRAETSYFSGMATHFGADLVLHQLVNVSAGAYNRLRKNWANEVQGGSDWRAVAGKQVTRVAGAFDKAWNTHNKVEHFWDTYVRLRFLGDHGKVFPDEKDLEGKAFPQPIGLPTIEALQSYARGKYNEAFAGLATDPRRAARIDRYKTLEEALRKADACFQYERVMAFPQPFADRVLGIHPKKVDPAKAPAKLKPFVYLRVVHPKDGAYPNERVSAKVIEEKTTPQMGSKGSENENKKLEFFSSTTNASAPACSNNYLTYFVCPDLPRLRVEGPDVFFDRSALVPFLRRALAQATTFAKELGDAYANDSAARLTHVARWWNLDTGLGLRVVNQKSDTPFEVLTRLDFVHVLDSSAGGAAAPLEVGSIHGYHRAKDKVRDGDLEFDRPDEKDDTPVSSDAFPTRGEPEFATILAVNEPSDGKFLNRLRLKAQGAIPMSRVQVDMHDRNYEKKFDGAFFGKWKPPAQTPASVKSKSSTKPNIERLKDLAHRLNLELRVSIAKLGTDPVGMFLYGSPKGIEDDWGGETKDWIKTARVLKAMDDAKPDGLHVRTSGALTVFRCRLLANFEKDKNLLARTAKDLWNNVVSYGPAQANYGRNFAISTARTETLRPRRWGNFDARKDFSRCPHLFPTEQIFFTLHPLVRTKDGVYDLFSKEPVQETHMAEIRKIKGVGFVKIVLYYELGPGGACQLRSCHIDGEPVRVEFEDAPSKG